MEKLQSVEQIKPIKKIFIAQRGEIALRAAKACLKRGIPAVVPYTFADANSLASEIAEAHEEEGWELAALGGTSQEENFTNHQILLEEIDLHGCDAVFLGYGFLAEDYTFVKKCEEKGIRVLSPPSSVMKITGDKINAKNMAKQVKIGRISSIPILEGTGNLENFEQVVKAANELGYPLMLKDPNTGGGSGNSDEVGIGDEKELEASYKSLKEKPGNKQLFMERYISNAVHVEVQIVADQYGNVVSLGERDCTLQRKSQKVIEESPSPHISDHLRGVLETASINFAKDRRVKYQGVGTFEYIIDLDKKGHEGDPAWYFMEINPRIQVEHPVTEEQTGIDIVGLMIDIAEGKPLPFTQQDIKPKGHTIEARVYAENPNRNFAKIDDVSLVSVLRYSEAEGIRIEPAIKEGDELSPWYDHTIMKVIAHGETRELARERLIKLLSGTEIVGTSNNLHFLTELLNTERFRDGKVTTTFIKKWWGERMKERVHSVAEFINGGTFIPYPPSKEFNPKLLPRTSVVVSRRGGSKTSFQDHLERLEKEKGTLCAASYGVLERDGVRLILYILDFDINNGAFGVQEANVLEDACKLSCEQDLDLVTLVSTVGVDNWQNIVGLTRMTTSVAAITDWYRPKLHINVYHGSVYGGVPASFSGIADFQIIVDSEETKLGFSGGYLVARNAGVQIPENTRAAEVYKILAETDERFQGLHSAIKHYQARNVDFVVSSLGEASDKITHLVHNLAKEESIIDPTRIYEPREQIAPKEGSSEAARFDRAGFSKVWFGPVSRIRERLLQRSISRAKNKGPLSNYERWHLIHELTRPTAADLLDTRMGLFDDTVLLSGPPLHFEGEDEYYPAIIAAVARIEDIRLLVIAQQTGRVNDEITAKMVKKYNAQKPEDWEFVEHIINGIGLKNRLPILTITDTEGADPSPEAESRGQSKKIAKVIEIRNKYPYTSLALLLGLDNSGGGETFFSRADGNASAKNGLGFVADARTKSWIQGGHWFDNDQSAEFKEFINGEETARAEVMRDMTLVDYIIEEGSGGAHRNPKLFARNIRQWLLPTLREDILLSLEDRKERRKERQQALSNLFSIPAV